MNSLPTATPTPSMAHGREVLRGCKGVGVTEGEVVGAGWELPTGLNCPTPLGLHHCMIKVRGHPASPHPADPAPPSLQDMELGVHVPGWSPLIPRRTHT